MKSFFSGGNIKYSHSQRIGIIILFVLIFTLQLIIIFADFSQQVIDGDEARLWLSLQKQVDSIRLARKTEVPKIYLFNPNFITDFKGYRLGMTTSQIDRLHAFRKLNKFVNSAEEFQQVTGVSDSLLKILSPQFKFPDWVRNKKINAKSTFEHTQSKERKPVIIRDINTATREELMEVYGIGPAFSDRILKEREKYGAFMTMKQMEYVWGLPPEAVQNLSVHFNVQNTSGRKTININTASVRELAAFPFFRYALAREIVTYRSMNNGITNVEDLTKINGFPTEKAEIIALYLEF
jgi:DNA uptake protein ComE-like DNA-binding protein